MWYYVLAAYVVIGVLAYAFVFVKWTKPLWEKVWYSIFWMPVLVAWFGHKFYNNIKK